MICPNEKCKRIMVKKSEGLKWVEYICPQCKSLHTIIKNSE